MPTFPLINGVYYDHASIEVDFGLGGVVVGLKEIKYTHKLTPGIVRGTRPDKLARTRGEYDAEGSFVLWLPDYYDLIAKFGPGYMETSFDITICFGGIGSPLAVTVLSGCRIKQAQGGSSQGTEPLTMSCELDIMRVYENGIPALLNPLG